MIEPTLALQTAIRTKLVSTYAVLERVEADNIRSGSTRPDNMPTIIMANGSTTLHGHDYTSQRAAWVNLDLHIWARDEGQDAAKEIAFIVQSTLDKRLLIEGGYCDSFKVTRSVFMRDPDPTIGHGILSVEALVRWIV
ncbi:DUF3168 domain-containing protein [Mesorhizobium sp. SB112]|uniref:tail completion protein gp17 n=1 Tax=Mesorhizobium sp. SB112 TaxID=3151853 RepID=UPI0032633A7E